jgi:hypothetical protein
MDWSGWHDQLWAFLIDNAIAVFNLLHIRAGSFLRARMLAETIFSQFTDQSSPVVIRLGMCPVGGDFSHLLGWYLSP